MKTRNGFVSNSSSSSFVIVTPEMRRKAEEDYKKYKAKNVIRNQNCPHCKSENIKGTTMHQSSFTDHDISLTINQTGRMYQYIRCLDCKKDWNDIFNFVEQELYDDCDE
jgi:hypothetical protein